MSLPPSLLRPLKRALPLHQYIKRDHLDDNLSHEYWYWSHEAAAIKYGIFFGILTLFILLLMGAWFHAKQRLKRGQAPLTYHRWLVPRSQRNGPASGPENNFSFYQSTQGAYGPGAGYSMNPMPPPPAYNPNYQQPPGYEPPAEGKGAPMAPAPAAQNPFQDPLVGPSASGGGSSSAPMEPVGDGVGRNSAYGQGGRYA
ncbi:hypothetical protein EX30DRAFT_236025 [Ascodesmis nigricans]|uniref:Uncharacterized protein n=1 Tax=Ascodesmis nigricans TaxID=341454 RepID=A0A4V3SIZ0_9PEZI|nr:hypothetical protein EX30DRAFT_236025 [Ascodesmis nigricans]